MPRTPGTTGLAFLLLAAALGAPAAARVPKAVVDSASREYTFMWWAHGLRDPRRVVAIQTNRLAAAMDVSTLALTHLMPLPSPPTATAALSQPNAAIFGPPNARLALAIQAGGKTYRAVRGPRRNEDCQLVESGRFFQRRAIYGLGWSDGAPAVEACLEVAAWPDRLALLLRLAPEAALAEGGLSLSLRCPAELSVRPATPGAVLSRDRKTGTRTVRLPTRRWPAGQERELALVVSVGERTDAAPVKVTARQIAPRAADLPVTVDPAMGWHRIGLRDDVTGRTPESRHNRIERVRLTLANGADRPQAARLCFAKGLPGRGGVFGITGLSAMLRDAEGYPTGLGVQISKNWHTSKPSSVRRPRRPGRYGGPWYRGLTMLTVPGKTTLTLEYTSVNALWGGVPAASHAQLCLVGWGSNQLWEQAAIGAWGETLCFEPDQGQRGGAVLDTRPLMVWATGSRPRRKWGWTCNVGGADFLAWYDPAGKRKPHSRMKTLRHATGPVLTETTYAGRTAGAEIDLRYTVGLCRTDDLARGIYRFRYDIRKPVEFSRLVLLQCGGDHYSYTGERKFAWGNQDGLVREWDTQWGGGRYKTRPFQVGGRPAWFSMHQAVSRAKGKEAWANRGLVIRRWQARLGGKPAGLWAAERGAKVRGRDTSLIDLLPPPAVKKLLPGDFVEATVEHIVMPQLASDYYGPNAALRAALKTGADTWKMIHREAVGNELEIKVRRGTLLRGRPTRILADRDAAEVSIIGGRGYVPVTFAGLSDYRRPILEIRHGEGPWQPVDQSVHGRDFWQANYEPARRAWAMTYSLPLDTPGDRRRSRSLRFRLEKNEKQPAPGP